MPDPKKEEEDLKKDLIAWGEAQEREFYDAQIDEMLGDDRHEG